MRKPRGLCITAALATGALKGMSLERRLISRNLIHCVQTSIHRDFSFLLIRSCAPFVMDAAAHSPTPMHSPPLL